MKQPSIVIAGHICIDRNTTERASYTSWGSSVLYISQYLRSHGQTWVTSIGSYGTDLIPYLPDVMLLPPTPNRPASLRYENDTSSGQRTWKCHHANTATPPELTSEIVAAVGAADIIIVATLLRNYSADDVRKLLSLARPNSLKILCPQGYFRQVQADGRVEPRDFTEAPDIISLFNLVIYSTEDHPRALEQAQAWKQTIHHPAIVVTQAELGASIVTADRIIAVPTTPIPANQIVDSVGCGDVFDAACALEYHRTHDLRRAIEAGHRAAATKLTTTPAR